MMQRLGHLRIHVGKANAPFMGAEKVEKAVNIDKDLSYRDQKCGAIRLQCHVQVKVSVRVKQISRNAR